MIYIKQVLSYKFYQRIVSIINSKNKIIKKKEEKMLSIVKSMSLNGLDGYLVSVQVDVSGGIPAWEIVRTS